MEDTTLIYYRGNIRYETIGELIHKFKQQAPLLGISMGTYKRILLIIIESLENMMKHSENPEPDTGNDLPQLSVTLKDNKYIIETTNPISTVNIPHLKARIDQLNNLDQQELKNLYKETITDGVFTKRGGAGLGLIEIAKISCNPILYDFQPAGKNHNRFRQLVTVDVKL